MSFKREGDDLSQLNLLKKRRISDLLAEDIPEDEAFLMRSGRYSCTVCHQRPVFDTITMLQVHRNGKKHLGNVKSYYTKKQNLMKEIEKRKQLLSLTHQQGNGSLFKEVVDEAPLLTQTRRAAHHALLKAAPYKGCAGSSTTQESDNKRGHVKTFQDTRATFFQRLSKHPLHPNLATTQSHSLPGNRNLPPNVQSDDSAFTSHGAKGKNASQSDGHQDDRASHCQLDAADAPRTSCDVTGQSFEVPLTVAEKKFPVSFQLQPYIPKHQRKSDLLEVRRGDPQSSTPSPKESPSSQECLKQNKEPPTSRPVLHLTNTPLPYASSTASVTHCEQQTGARPRTNHEKQGITLKCRKGKSVKSTKNSARKSLGINEDSQRPDREKYLQLTSCGWTPDWKGGWVQDQDVEFDSDDEEPP